MGEVDEEKQLTQRIAKILDEACASSATHNRKLKELSVLRSKSKTPLQFFASFSKALTPLLAFQRRLASSERVVRFVSIFSAVRDPNFPSHHDAFLESFLKFLVVASASANKTVRFRACQFISEIIMRLPDEAEVSSDMWDEVIDCVKLRAGDKVPLVRSYAIRALSRFVHDSENSDILDLFMEMLPLESNTEVRKTLVLSLPPSNMSLQVIIDCTLDVSDSVRKAAYCVLGIKFPLQSLSIKHRTIILQRGLSDRSISVSKECLKLMKNEWLSKSCNENVVELLKYLDVETYENIGESVMGALLNDGLVKINDGESIRKYICSAVSEGEMVEGPPRIHLMEAEVAFYWRMVCKHLAAEAQEKGSEAAATMGTEAAVYAAEASENNDLLDSILPATISDYVYLLKAHISAGLNYRFACRQLLLLGAMLDFSDATNRKVASVLVQELLDMPLDNEVDDDGNTVVVGDGLNLGGDRDWADAVSGFARKVHAAPGEFEEVVLGAVEKLAQPCRERIANSTQWMQSLAVAALLLENAKLIQFPQGKSIANCELLPSLLLPGAKHSHLDVQRIAVRCLGLFGLLEKKPSEELVKQLRFSFVKSPLPVAAMSCKALIDLGMWHGHQEIDKVARLDLFAQPQNDEKAFDPICLSLMTEDQNSTLLDLLYNRLVTVECCNSQDVDENDSIQAVIGEGFAKILLLSEKYPGIPSTSHTSILAQLICLFYSNESENLQRLKQSLVVFFEHYPSLSATHKKYISEAFVRVMRSMWPGINGNSGGSSVMVSKMRKRAVQASRFMLQMMQAPLYTKESDLEDKVCDDQSPEVLDNTAKSAIECREEGLAIRIATEVASLPGRKTPAERSYACTLCQIVVSVQFNPSEQLAIKIMRRLCHYLVESALTEKDLVKDLKHMAVHLEAIDKHSDLELTQDHANILLGRLNLDFNLNVDGPVLISETPQPHSTRPTRTRRKTRCEDSSDDDNMSPASAVPNITTIVSARSQRVSKTAALSKMTTASRELVIDEDVDDDENDVDHDKDDSDVTFEDD